MLLPKVTVQRVRRGEVLSFDVPETATVVLTPPAPGTIATGGRDTSTATLTVQPLPAHTTVLSVSPPPDPVWLHQDGGVGTLRSRMLLLEGETNTLAVRTAALEQTALPFAPPYETTFSQANLNILGVLPVLHNLHQPYTRTQVWDEVGDEIQPDDIEMVSVDAIAVSLTSFVPLVGFYTIRVSL